MCLIVFGVNYLIFKNTHPYENLVIEIINNPITQQEDIHFAMAGTKVLDCSVDNAYGEAHNNEGKVVVLDEYTAQYIRNVSKGENVSNSWKLRKPDELSAGIWRVNFIGNWRCSYWIFEDVRERRYDNILLIVK